MLKSFVAALVILHVFAQAQSDSSASQVGTRRISRTATRSPEDTSTIRTNVRATQKKPRNLKFQFLNQAYAYQRDLTNGERPVASNYTYAGVSYKFAPTQYASVRLPFS